MIGERLAELRKEQRMTQRELAKQLSVSEKTISSYENNHNNPHDEIKIQIAKIFNVSLDYLLGAIDVELLLDRSNVIILPKYFPIEANKEIGLHIELLSFKYKQII